MFRSSILPVVFAALLLAGFTRTAAATSTMIQDASYTVGNSGAVNITHFDVASAGVLTVKLSDIPWPQSLASAELLITTSTGLVVGRLTSFGTESFEISGAETLYAFSYGVVRNLPGLNFGFGSYGVRLDFSPSLTAVPLPSGAGLFVGALLLLTLAGRRAKSVRPDPATDRTGRADGVLVAIRL